MLIQEREIKLKDGRNAVLRNPRESDAMVLIKLMQTASAETEFLARYPEEWNLTEEQEQQWVRSVRESDGVCAIVCEVDGCLAGNCEVRFHRGIKMGHRGSVGIVLTKEYWGLGIGTAMFRELIRVAGEREGAAQLELDFVEGNSRAQALYEKMGFAITGVKPNAIRLKDGRLLNEYTMIRPL